MFFIKAAVVCTFLSKVELYMKVFTIRTWIINWRHISQTFRFIFYPWLQQEYVFMLQQHF